MGYYDDHKIERLVGKKITKILMNEYALIFETDQGNFAFSVEGDCCSHSYFYDFVGAQKLLDNGPVVSASEVDLDEASSYEDWEYIQCYGFEIVTEHPVWGEQTSVFSFRNSSNGYYGGWMYDAGDADDLPSYQLDELKEITGDLVVVG